MIDEPFLQNHPNDQTFPVEDSYGDQSSFHDAFFSFWVFFLLLTFFYVLLSISVIVAIKLTLLPWNLNELMPWFKWIWSASGLSIVLMLIFTTILGDRAPKEQKRYYRATNQTWLPEEKRQALRLDLITRFGFGGWNETLEHEPLAWRVAHQSYCYKTFTLQETVDYQEAVKSDWGIESAEDFRKTVARLYDGMHSQSFSQLKKNNPSLLTRLANQINQPQEYVLSCLESVNGRPPKLIWGFDLLRITWLARNCFSAGYIQEEEAWEHLLKTADLAYEIFESYDAFYLNYVLGFSYWSQNQESIDNRLSQYDNYQKNCTWPMRDLPWPEPKGIFLTHNQHTGFSLLTGTIKNRTRRC